MIVRSIGVWSAAKLYGAISAVMGLLFGLVFAMFSLIGTGMAGDEAGPAWMGGIVGMGAVIVLPIMYGVMGLIGGAIMAFLYNVFAGMVGGVELDIS